MGRKLLLAVTAILILNGGTPARADYNRTLTKALEDPLGNLPYLLDAVPWQVSSFDRTGANNDGFTGAFSFLRTTADGEYVVFEEEGPGLLSHIWFTNPAPAERIRFYFDGEKIPRIDLPIFDLFNGTEFPFVIPLVGDDSRSSGGFYTYLPMPFRKGLRITTTGNACFYHITYLKFSSARGVKTFDPDLDADETELLHATVGRWERRGDPAITLPPDGLVHEATAILSPGDRSTIFQAGGSGIIDGLIVDVDPSIDWYPMRPLRILAYWDGDEEPSIDAPLREFFGSSFQTVRYKSLPLGMKDEQFYSYFRMPFADGARIVIENGTAKELPEFRFRVFYRPLPRLPRGMGRFHAQGRAEIAKEGKPIEILRRSGRGHYIGVTMSIQKSDSAGKGDIGFLEGDEQIYIDGDPRAHLHGTGTEDYFNGGWYFNRAEFSLPFHGHHFRDVEGGRIGVYRFHVLDPIPYQKEIQAFIEHGAGNEKVGTRYRLVAYWYEDRDAGKPPLSEPIHRPMEALTVIPPPEGGSELRALAPELETSGDPLEFALLELFDPKISGGHLLHFQADEPGDFLEFQTQAEYPDRYIFRAFHCRGPDMGTFRLEIDGKPAGPELDGFATQFEPNIETHYGEFQLRGESSVVRLVVTGKNPASKGYGIALTGLGFHSRAKYADRWWVLAPFDDPGRSYFKSVSDIEKGQFSLEDTYTGKSGREIRWQKVEVAEDGLLDFQEVFGEVDDAVAYALTYLHADRPSEEESYLLLGSDDGARVWVNGQKVHEVDKARGLTRDEDRIPITYTEGVTPILIKVFDEKVGWSMTMRINDPHGALRYDYE
jgi:hypothetical protein